MDPANRTADIHAFKTLEVQNKHDKDQVYPEQKIQTVLESIKTNISTAELCCKYNVHSPTFQTWRQQFMDAGKARLSHYGKVDPVKASKKEIDSPKRI